MSPESISIIGVTVICWLFLLLSDAAVSAIASSVFNVRFMKVFTWGLVSLVIPPAFIAYGATAGRNKLETNEVTLTFSSLPPAFDGYRIVHISDIHARSFTNRTSVLEKAVETINGLGPDLITFTGDLITLTPDEIDATEVQLGKLKAADGVMSVIGNHDYGIYAPDTDNTDTTNGTSHLERLVQKEESLGWKLLMNENIIIRKGKDSIAVIGVENTSPSGHFPSRGDLDKASEGTEKLFRILLSHDPMHWESEVTGKNYQLTLSGHTHAMQFSIFGWSPSRYIFKQNRGLYGNDDEYLYVNAGLGETIFPARIGASSEITLITLKRAS